MGLFPDEAAVDERIVAIKPTQRDSQRATVRVKGEGAGAPRKSRVVVTLSLKHIAELGLSVGQAWTPELEEEVLRVGEYDAALRKAMDRLARRAMSRRDLDRKLRDAEVESADVRTRVLDRLEELNLLDDEAYGRALVRELTARKPAGPALLKQKLYAKGLSFDLIGRLIAEYAPDEDEQAAAAEELARKKLATGTMRKLDPQARRRRLYGVLGRRGYPPGVIAAVMERVADTLG